jgi:hypothetical protein
LNYARVVSIGARHMSTGTGDERTVFSATLPSERRTRPL